MLEQTRMKYRQSKEIDMQVQQVSTQNNSDTNKKIMLSFISETVGLSSQESEQLTLHAQTLPDNATMPDLIEHLNTLNVAVDFLDKLKVFGRDA